MKKKRVLFVTYGGGHVKMLLPVADHLRCKGEVDVVFLGLTTARVEIKSLGFPCFGYSDFLDTSAPDGARAFEYGEYLIGKFSGGQIDDRNESIAYLGMNFLDLVYQFGENSAREMYSVYGRQCFNPLRSMMQILQAIDPDLVVATNSPRSERAAILCARNLGIRSLCLVDLFAVDEISWIGQADFSDCVCVLNDLVKNKFVSSGRDSSQVVVTGNPAFDGYIENSKKFNLQRKSCKKNEKFVLFVSAPEPEKHPYRPDVIGDAGLPLRVFRELCDMGQGKYHPWSMLIRPHPSELSCLPPWVQPEQIFGQDVPLESVLQIADVVVVLVSTVAIQAKLMGCYVVQVSGALFESAAPFLDFGVADVKLPLKGLKDFFLNLDLREYEHAAQKLVLDDVPATRKVVGCIEHLL